MLMVLGCYEIGSAAALTSNLCMLASPYNLDPDKRTDLADCYHGLYNRH